MGIVPGGFEWAVLVWEMMQMMHWQGLACWSHELPLRCVSRFLSHCTAWTMPASAMRRSGPITNADLLRVQIRCCYSRELQKLLCNGLRAVTNKGIARNGKMRNVTRGRGLMLYEHMPLFVGRKSSLLVLVLVLHVVLEDRSCYATQ